MAGDDDGCPGLLEAVLHPRLAQVGVDRHHGQAVLERRDGGGHPLGARVGVHHDLREHYDPPVEMFQTIFLEIIRLILAFKV